jgi:hypothetical protein
MAAGYSDRFAPHPPSMSRRLLLAALGLVGAASIWFVQSRGSAVGAAIVEGPRVARSPEGASARRTSRIPEPAVADGRRRVPESSPHALHPELHPDGAVGALLALADGEGGRLDLSGPELDLALLAQLRDLVRVGDLSAETLAEACGGFAPGDVRRSLLVLAASFARGHGPQTDRFFSELAVVEDGHGGDDLEQEALAAVRALGLARRSEALSEIVGSLIDRANLGEQQGFAGLARLRVVFALAALERAPSGSDLEAWLDRSGREPRIGGELWALAVRSDPRVWGERAITAALAGDHQARLGLEALTGPEHREAITALATGALAGSDPWVERSAWRALVAGGDFASFELVDHALRTADAGRRAWLAEALHTWREPVFTEAALVQAVALVEALEPRSEMAARVLERLDLRFARWSLDADAPARARMAAAIESLPGAESLDSEVARRLAAWHAYAD